MRLCARVIAAILLSVFLGADLSGQSRGWGIGLDLGLTRFWGASEPVPPATTPGFKPYRPTTFGLRLDRNLGRGRGAIGMAYAASGLGTEGDDLAIVAKGGLDLVQVTPEFGYRLGTLGPANEVRLFAGPVFDVWMLSGEDARLRLGGRAGLELLVPFGGSFAGTVRAHGGVTGSLFRDTEVPPDFRTKAMLSAGIALGLRLGL